MGFCENIVPQNVINYLEETQKSKIVRFDFWMGYAATRAVFLHIFSLLLLIYTIEKALEHLKETIPKVWCLEFWERPLENQRSKDTGRN